MDTPDKPATQSPSQRQAAYRSRRALDGEHARINVWVDIAARFALRRLARRYAVTQAQMLSQLICEADMRVLDTLELDSQEWDAYFGVRTSRHPRTPVIEETDMT